MERLGYEPDIPDKLRPYILLIGGKQACGKTKRAIRNTNARPTAHTAEVLIVSEIGYRICITAEGRYRGKELEKQEQHQQLRSILRKLGYCSIVTRSKYIPLYLAPLVVSSRAWTTWPNSALIRHGVTFKTEIAHSYHHKAT